MRVWDLLGEYLLKVLECSELDVPLVGAIDIEDQESLSEIIENTGFVPAPMRRAD